MSAVVVTITLPVPESQATQGNANRIANRVMRLGFSEHAGNATARGCPYAANVTAEVVESRVPVPTERGAFTS